MVEIVATLMYKPLKFSVSPFLRFSVFSSVVSGVRYLRPLCLL